jgi:hypothetical protein
MKIHKSPKKQKTLRQNIHDQRAHFTSGMIWIAVLFFSSVNLDVSSSLQCIKAQSSKLEVQSSKLKAQSSNIQAGSSKFKALSSKLKALAAADDS